MHRSLPCVVVLSLALFVGGSDGEEELVLRPVGETFTRALDSALLLTCEVVDAVKDFDYGVKWFAANNREIVDRTGSRRYVEVESLSMKKLYITKIVNQDEGKYTCRATVGGQQKEKSVQLDIFKDITFDSVPSPQHPKVNTDAVIECKVSGRPKPEVTWRYGGKRIQFGGRYEFVEGRGLKIANITTGDDGNYTCRAEVDSDGRYDERKITVEVHIPPKIVEDQLKVEGVEGAEARISCRAEGLPTPQYAFYKGSSSTPLRSTASVEVDTKSGLVTFRPLRKADEGSYACRAFNDVGNETASGRVRVLVKPAVYELDSVAADEGRDVKLTCRSRGDPTPTMTFRKAGGEPFKAGSTGRVTVADDGRGKLELSIGNLEPFDASNYTCRAENKLGHHEMTSAVTVRYKPRFAANHSRTVYAWAGSIRNVSCVASGEPAPSVEWHVRGRAIANNDTYHIYDLGAGRSHLRVKVRDVDQSWIYTRFACKTKNSLGENEISIELKRASVPGRPALVNVTKSMPTMLTLDVQRPAEDGGVPVVGYRVEYDSKMKFDIATDGLIRLENLEPSTNYTIAVRAKNDVGVGEPRHVTVITESIRRPYPLVIASRAEGNSGFRYTLRWQHPESGGKPITQYEIKLRQVKKKTVNGSDVFEPATPDWTTVIRQDDADEPMTEFEFTDLLEQASYEVQVRAANQLGWSDASRKFVFSTSLATPEDLALASTMPVLGVGAVIAITIVVLIVILAIIDVSCYFVNSCGVTQIVCSRLCGQAAPFNKEKAAEEGESKEALTKGQPPQEATNASEPAAVDGTKEQTQVPPTDDVDKKPLLIDEKQAGDDEKKPEELKAEDGKADDVKDVDREDANEQKVSEPEKGEGGGAETG